MNNLHKERLEQFIGEGWEWEEKMCKTMQNNELYEECSPATPIYAFSTQKEKVLLTEIK